MEDETSHFWDAITGFLVVFSVVIISGLFLSLVFLI